MTFRIDKPGPFSCLQDRGRFGYGHLGVTRSGAFDQGALALANRLLGNRRDAAGLETLGNFNATALADCTITITGARAPVQVAGRGIGHASLHVVRAGQVVSIGQPSGGLRVYLGVRGGFASETVLGSRSWDSLGHIGAGPLAPGDSLPIGNDIESAPVLSQAPIYLPASALTHITLEMTPGPHRTLFPPQLVRAQFAVSSRCDRVGIRLTGPQIMRQDSYNNDEPQQEQVAPIGLIFGAIEIPPNGEPIILGPDHPTTGGYPVLGVLADRDLDQCAQLRPGQSVTLAEATHTAAWDPSD